MMGRGGTTLVELLVALTLFAVAGTAVVQMLTLAEVELERAEVTLRAVFLARELAEGPAREVERGLPRGVLSGERLSVGPPHLMHLIYEPKAEGGASGVLQLRLRSREWHIGPRVGTEGVGGGGAGDGLSDGAP